MGSGADARDTRRTGHIYLEARAERPGDSHAQVPGETRRPQTRLRAGPRCGQPFPGSHPAFPLRDSPRRGSNLLRDYTTLPRLLNAHHLSCVHPINSPLHSPLCAQTPATSHLYANCFATWTKVIMRSDRKLTGLKSKMEINKLTPLSGREDGHACWRLGGRQPQPRRPARTGQLPGRPRRRSPAARLARTYPARAASLRSAQHIHPPRPGLRASLPSSRSSPCSCGLNLQSPAFLLERLAAGRAGLGRQAV